MKPEVKRILKLVEDGTLSAEDAAELIEAFNDGEHETPPPPSSDSAPGEAPKSDESAADKSDEHKGVFQELIDAIEKLSKDVSSRVDWQNVAKQAKESAHKAAEAVRVNVEKIGEGRFEFGWFKNGETKEVELPLSIPAGKTLKIENPCGDITVRAGSPGQVHARATFKAATADEAKEKAANYVLMIEEGEHAVVIRQPDMSGLEVDLEITAPAEAPLEIRTASGDISVADMKAGVRISGKSGDMALKSIEGPIEVSSASGDITIEDAITPSLSMDGKSGDITMRRVRGNANVRTASGDVRIENGDSRTLSVECVSGDCEVSLDVPVSGNVSVRTVSGDALVKVPSGSDCRVSVSTLRGDATVRAELEDEAKADQRVTGKLGEGSGSLDISAVTGNVTLEVV